MSAPGAVVVGTGFGCRVQVPALRAAGFEVLALVGTDRERTARRAERLGIPGALDSFEAALALDGVAAVTIATPPSTHAALAIAAADAGKHVVCEKPFALDAPEAQRMLAAAESAGVVHLVGHEFRWAADRARRGAGHRRGPHRRAPAGDVLRDESAHRRPRDHDAGVVVRPGGRRRLARRVRLARRRPGPRLARRVRVAERGPRDDRAAAPAASTTRSASASASRPASSARCSRRRPRGAGAPTRPGSRGPRGPPARAGDRGGGRRRRRPRASRSRRPHPPRRSRPATTPATGSPTSSSAPTRDCARRCGPASTAGPIPRRSWPRPSPTVVASMRVLDAIRESAAREGELVRL